MKKLSIKQNRRRYYLHCKAKRSGNSIHSRSRLVCVSSTADATQLRYARILQSEYNYTIQTHID